MTLYYAHQYVTTQLSVAGGISDTDTLNITLQDVTGIDTTKPSIALLDYQDPLDLTKAEWITYTTINGSKVFQGVTRGAEGSIARTHSDGCSIAFPISKSHINNMADMLNGVTTITSPKINEDVALTATATELNLLHNKVGAWTSFVPSWTNLTPGTGTNTGTYCQIGKTVHFRTKFIFGAGSAVGAAEVKLTLPVTPVTTDGFIGDLYLIDAGTATHFGKIQYTGTLMYSSASSVMSYVATAAPFTWTTNDSICITGFYEAA